ncbi:MAG: outer membrane beta-barrel protein [Acidobacteriota bacterium]|nr:MAG: outer membrane beta-barrel protein [Acidobacteriota bacterium]
MANHVRRWANRTALAGFSLILAAFPAYADVFGDTAKGNVYLEAYGGYFTGDREELDKIETNLEGDVTYGVRGGGFFLDHWGAEVTLGFVESKIEREFQPPVETDTNAWLFEGTLFYAINPFSKGMLTLGGGVGYINIDSEIAPELKLPSGEEPNEGALVLHASVSLRIRPGQHFYFRPDVRYRFVRDVKFGAVEDKNLDTFEGTLALGWKFW